MHQRGQPERDADDRQDHHEHGGSTASGLKQWIKRERQQQERHLHHQEGGDALAEKGLRGDDLRQGRLRIVHDDERRGTYARLKIPAATTIRYSSAASLRVSLAVAIRVSPAGTGDIASPEVDG